MRITLTGEVTIEHAGRRVSGAAVGGPQVRLALALLVLERASPVRKDQLADLLWPDQPPATWEVAQRGILARVRRAFALAGWDPPDVLTTHDGTYRLRLPADVVVDVEEVATEVAAAEAALAVGNRVVALSHAAAAAGLAERSLLESDDSVWLDWRRDQLRGQVTRALTALGRSALAGHDTASAVEIAIRVVGLDPFSEPGHRLLIEAHAAAGDRMLATRAFERYREVLAQEIGAEPSPELERLWRAAVEPRGERPDEQPQPSRVPGEVLRLRRAGDEALRVPDPALAAERYAAASATAARCGAVEVRADLLVDIGQARKLAGGPEGAEDALMAAADLARTESRHAHPALPRCGPPTTTPSPSSTTLRPSA